MNEQNEPKTCSALCKYACGVETVGGEVLIRCSKDKLQHVSGSECPGGNTEVDMVNQPPHYTQGGIECIDAIKAAITGKPPYEAWLVGQVIRYLWRYNFKNGVQDIEKAQFYINKLLQEVKNSDNNPV